MLQFLLSIADESDHAKIEYLYNRYRGDMLRIAKSRLHGMGIPNVELDAEDAVQNAFVKIVKYIKNIDFSQDDKKIRAYVLRIVAHEAIRVAKKYKMVDDIDEMADRIEDGDFFGEMRIQTRYDDVIRIIREMDERYSIPLTLRFVEKMEIGEIAQIIGIAEKSVYTRLDRARQILLDKLNEGERL